MNTAEEIKVFFADNLSQHSKSISHGFFSRQGGVSSGIYQSLNASKSSNDDPQSVALNRSKIARFFKLTDSSLSSLYQCHSADCVVLSATDSYKIPPRADALVTKESGLILSVLTADCTPVLFYDPVSQVIGAAHAGWKGAISGILHTTLTKMEYLGANKNTLCAAIGPTLSVKYFEVKEDFLAMLKDKGINDKELLEQRNNKTYFNLSLFITKQLQSFGVQNIENLNLCTYDLEDLFFSYRRSAHKKEPDYGRLMSAIVLK